MTTSSDEHSTRTALIEAGMHLFGHQSFDGTSIRAIARRAGANVAAITYHFGGKDGLRLACAEAIGDKMNGVVSPAQARPLPQSPQAAEAEMQTAIRGLVALILGSQDARDMVAFVMRELTVPGTVADLIFDRVFLPRHDRLCRLWSVATGQPADTDHVKLVVFSLIGQIAYFRIAEPFVARRMDWPETGPQQAEQIAQVLIGNLTAMIERNRA
ncbi:CerR family C-terminal domain-containing protein [Tropicibacter oceani]|uniref:CerR family C-terminal domain-containing protein n=1 Tax=Tropicibacter oceani TaxID=3058420 RepID=A0ABY8QHH4_9RHOB|nr:CerR family C-terminal domain-containing protein [Tropicibacter oceani]WGW04102.1 CerR family C-terminal domain-containing protein [Tropicibacter oceani]